MRIALRTPTHCSACFQQRLDEPHVDCEAYYDGPVIDVGNGIKQCIDDLMLCQTCARTIGALVGMVVDEDAQAELVKLRKEVGELRAFRARTARKNQAIEKALATA